MCACTAYSSCSQFNSSNCTPVESGLHAAAWGVLLGVVCLVSGPERLQRMSAAPGCLRGSSQFTSISPHAGLRLPLPRCVRISWRDLEVSNSAVQTHCVHRLFQSFHYASLYSHGSLVSCFNFRVLFSFSTNQVSTYFSFFFESFCNALSYFLFLTHLSSSFYFCHLLLLAVLFRNSHLLIHPLSFTQSNPLFLFCMRYHQLAPHPPIHPHHSFSSALPAPSSCQNGLSAMPNFCTNHSGSCAARLTLTLCLWC